MYANENLVLAKVWSIRYSSSWRRCSSRFICLLTLCTRQVYSSFPQMDFYRFPQVPIPSTRPWREDENICAAHSLSRIRTQTRRFTARSANPYITEDIVPKGFKNSSNFGQKGFITFSATERCLIFHINT